MISQPEGISQLQFCTYFDINYIHRGLTLYSTLERQTARFTLWILCFDERTHEVLTSLNLPDARLIRRQDFEAGDDELTATKQGRTTVEYYWTCTPSLMLYIFRHFPDVQTLTYVDADMAFFGSPSALLAELGEGSVLLLPHDFSPAYAGHETAGRFNVGILAFQRDANATKCLTWWRERCLEWCFDRHEDGKFGDQAYLNRWPELFPGVIVSNRLGLRVAPWNASQFLFEQEEDGKVFVNGEQLICYHFHALRFCTRSLVLLIRWSVPLSGACREAVYRPYVYELLKIERELKVHGFTLPVPRSGFPWRYLFGRVLRMQPLRNFLWAPQSWWTHSLSRSHRMSSKALSIKKSFTSWQRDQ